MEYPNDEEAIIFSFPQEDSRMAIGFESFLLTSKDRENLQQLKESGKCITVNWPEVCDVGSAKATRKLLKRCRISRLPATVIDFGDRVTMLRRLKSLEKTGYLSPPKSERKNLAAKKLEDSPTHKPVRKIKRIPKTQRDKENEDLLALIMEEGEENDGGSGEAKIDKQRNDEILATESINKDEQMKESSQAKTHEEEGDKTMKTGVDKSDDEELIVKKRKLNSGDQVSTEGTIEKKSVIIPEDTKEAGVHSVNNFKNMTDIGGGVFVRNKILSSVQKMKDIEQATSDIINAVFNKEELAMSSYSGRVPNVHKARGLEAKPQLDNDKVLAIQDYIFKYFEDTKGNKKLFKSRIASMCSTAAKGRKNKAIN